jgi:plastocyanin
VRGRTQIIAASGVASAAALALLAMTPIHSDSREQVFEIPKGTWAHRMSGERVAILPDHIHLTVGLRDVLVLRNHDDVPQIFGPTLMMPGQSFSLPFDRPSQYQFACTAHASGQMTIVVDAYPGNPWARIVWRARAARRALW